MEYHLTASSICNEKAKLHFKNTDTLIGTTVATSDSLPNPAEVFLGAFAACMLKNVERFSEMMKFDYAKTTLKVSATRLENPPRMDDIQYELTLYSDDVKLNTELLKKNLEKYGTIYNTVNLSCSITGEIHKISNV
jgi:uncharacterized OsmC-like protein